MEPTIKNGDRVLVNRLAYLLDSPKIEDIVATKMDKKIFIKRITSVKQERYFIAGDNPNDSFDSRKFGMIGKDRVIGKVISTL